MTNLPIAPGDDSTPKVSVYDSFAAAVLKQYPQPATTVIEFRLECGCSAKDRLHCTYCQRCLVHCEHISNEG